MGGLTGLGMPGGWLPEWKDLRRVDFFGRVVEGGDEELRERGNEARRRVEQDCLQGGGKRELVMGGLVCLEKGEKGKSGKAERDGKRNTRKKVAEGGIDDGRKSGFFYAESLAKEVFRTGVRWRAKFSRDV